MIITVKNLGVIKKAEFDTSKKLTVFCGPNSTGKTYLAYVIYAALSNKEMYKLKSFDIIKKNLNTSSQILLKKEYLDELLSKIAISCKKTIGEVFGISEEKEKDFFSKCSINFSISEDDYKSIIEQDNIVNIYDKQYAIKKKKTEYINLDCFQSQILPPVFLWNIILHNLVNKGYTYMLPVERNSIYTFKTELSISRNQLLDTILEKKANISTITDLLGRKSRRYPLAIKESLNTANDLENVQKTNSELYNFAKELEDKLLHGSISVTQNGDVEYKTTNNVSLPIGISSSIVKTLSSLIITLKHQTNKGDLLIIDEPEMNFHPENQVILAEILAKISNTTPMIASTHSDYIIRELNNLIVAKSLEKKGKDMYKDYYDRDSLLDYKDVQVLYFNFDKDGKAKVKSLDIDEYGFAVESIDKTIRQQNQRTNSLFIQLDEINDK